jgi:hypothetical protein
MGGLAAYTNKINKNTCTSNFPTTFTTFTTVLYINILYHYFHIIRVVKSSE